MNNSNLLLPNLKLSKNLKPKIIEINLTKEYKERINCAFYKNSIIHY